MGNFYHHDLFFFSNNCNSFSKRATQIKSNHGKGQIKSTQISNSKNGLFCESIQLSDSRIVDSKQIMAHLWQEANEFHSWYPDWKGIAKKFFGFATHFDHMMQCWPIPRLVLENSKELISCHPTKNGKTNPDILPKLIVRLPAWLNRTSLLISSSCLRGPGKCPGKSLIALPDRPNRLIYWLF